MALCAFVLTACEQQRGFDEERLSNYLTKITGNVLVHPCEIVKHTQSGFDHHGDGGETYSIHISVQDHENILRNAKVDSLAKWKESEDAYILTLFPKNRHDTLTAVAVYKKDAALFISLSY